MSVRLRDEAGSGVVGLSVEERRRHFDLADVALEDRSGRVGSDLSRVQRLCRLAARIPLQVALVMLILILIAGIRAEDDFASDKLLMWTFVTGVAVLTLAMATFYVRMERLDRG